MDKLFLSNGVLYCWNEDKAKENFRYHRINFETAVQVFRDRLLVFQDATAGDEPREAAIGFTLNRRLLYVVSTEVVDDTVRIISAREATASERESYENRA